MNERDKSQLSAEEKVKRNAIEAPMDIILADFTDLEDPSKKRYYIPGLPTVDVVYEEPAPESPGQA